MRMNPKNVWITPTIRLWKDIFQAAKSSSKILKVIAPKKLVVIYWACFLVRILVQFFLRGKERNSSSRRNGISIRWALVTDCSVKQYSHRSEIPPSPFLLAPESEGKLIANAHTTNWVGRVINRVLSSNRAQYTHYTAGQGKSRADSDGLIFSRVRSRLAQYLQVQGRLSLPNWLNLFNKGTVGKQIFAIFLTPEWTKIFQLHSAGRIAYMDWNKFTVLKAVYGVQLFVDYKSCFLHFHISFSVSIRLPTHIAGSYQVYCINSRCVHPLIQYITDWYNQQIVHSAVGQYW